MSQHLTRSNLLVCAGLVFLFSALLGNYVALPGYIRFLERGGVSAAGNTFDLDVLIGAVKTILWMFSFQLGVLCLSLAHSIRRQLATSYVLIGGVLWLGLWAWPNLPAPPALFYVVLGSVLLVAIGGVISLGVRAPDNKTTKTLMLGAIVFFAFATWEVCGLGTTGRMLHPEEAGAPMAHNILVTQSSKLMVEFVLAWVMLAASVVRPPVVRLAR